MAPQSPFFNVTEHIPELSALQKTIWSHHYDADGHPYPAVKVSECPFFWAMMAVFGFLVVAIVVFEVVLKIPLVRIRWVREERVLCEPELEMGSDTDKECGTRENV